MARAISYSSRSPLAAEAGTSRSVLIERFQRFLGEPPLTYLARWRMQLAARRLQTTRNTVLQIAAEVGYESEAAFNRAFKREFSLPPAQYRTRYLETAPSPLREGDFERRGLIAAVSAS